VKILDVDTKRKRIGLTMKDIDWFLIETCKIKEKVI
jgi:ribosomal protein S1